MRILPILLLSSCSYAVAMQQSKELSRMWLIPVYGFFQVREFPTYVTDNIYFEKEANLFGSYPDPHVKIAKISDKSNRIIKEETETYAAKILTNIRSDWKDRHVQFDIKDHKNNHIIIQKTNDSIPYAPQQYKSLNINTKTLEITVVDSYKIIASYSDLLLNEYNIGTWPTYSSYYIDKNNKQKLLRTSRKPHVIFKDEDGNLHTIQEEKLTVPILGIFGDLFTFLIRYHDVQLTRLEPTSGYVILKQNPFGWRNAMRTVNAAFLVWVAFVIYSKCNT
jgi:hypothetical protein